MATTDDSVSFVVNSSKTSTWSSVITEYLIFFTNPDSPIKDEASLFTYMGNDARIYSLYNAAEQKKYGKADESLIKFGTLIKVPKECLKREILPNAGNLAVDLNDIKLSLPPEVLAAFQDKMYVPIQQLSSNDNAGSTFLGNAYRVNHNVSVWCYCKALGDGDGKMVNITPFLDNVTTNVGDNGGNFIISLSPITCEYDETDGWVMSKSTYSTFAYQGQINTLVRDSLIGQDNGQFKRRTLFFHHLIQPNDVVFIQFEALSCEEKVRNFDPQLISSNNYFYPTQTAAGRFYDMIGLIDSSSMKYNPENTYCDIEINGRDLMKVIIDDGCYVYPLDYARGFHPDSGQAIQRILSKELYFFKAFVDVSVGYLTNFVMNLLSNISIVNNDQLFSGWGDRRSYRYDVNPTDIPTLTKQAYLDSRDTLENGSITKDANVTKNLAQGIWQIIKLGIDENVAPLRLVDTSITDYQGSILNYINKICQKPFCEFFGDTYGDQYYFIVRRPPFTQEAFLQAFDKMGAITIDEDVIQSEDLAFDDSEIYSWYRLRPSGSFIDKTVGDNLAAELTVWFEEFAKIYGAKAMDISTIYGQIFNVNTDQKTVEDLLTQFRKDLVYIISTTIYLPFTRKGTITINPGDRRIKRGMVIKHTGSGELFYVDNVSNSAAIGTSAVERTTTLTVSRGMVEIYARNKTAPGSKDEAISYFTIADFGLDITADTSKITASNIKINKDVLNFFLKRKQFASGYSVGSKDFTN